MSELGKQLNKRDSKMREYYESVFKHGFSGGYPMEWDDDFIEAITQHFRAKTADYLFKTIGYVPSDKPWEELWEQVNKKERK